MTIKVCVAGATGWTGSAVVQKLLDTPAFELSGAVARAQAGQDIGEALGRPAVGLKIVGSLAEALQQPTDVVIDYTKPDVVKANALAALEHGVRVVIGTSGLTEADYGEIEHIAQQKGLGVIAAGNFSITAALAKHFALIAARYLPAWEVIDYASAGKIDAPSGTTLELAEELSKVGENKLAVPLDAMHGPREVRGATVGNTQVHSVRLPSFIIAFETIFGLPDERLTIRHDAGPGAEPYVGGTLLAAERVIHLSGLVRGLDRLLFTD